LITNKNDGLKQLEIKIDGLLSELPKLTGKKKRTVSPELKKIESFVQKSPEANRDGCVSTAHYLLGLAKIENEVSKLLADFGVTGDGVREEFEKLYQSRYKIPNNQNVGDEGTGHETASDDTDSSGVLNDESLHINNLKSPQKEIQEKRREEAKKADHGGRSSYGMRRESFGNLDDLSFFSDLTAEAKKGLFEPVLCRSKELDEIYRIFRKKTQNWVWLVGDPRVGRSAIIRELARRIAAEKTPDFLRGNHIYKVDLKEFDQNRYEIISRDADTKINNICYINLNKTNLSTIAEQSNLRFLLNVANSLIVFSSTKSQFDVVTKEFPFLQDLFEPISVEPLDIDDTITCLRGLRHSLELQYKICFSDDALVATATLSKRHFKNEPLLAKSLDILYVLGDIYSQKLKGISQQLITKRDELDELKTNFLNENRIWDPDRADYQTMSEAELWSYKKGTILKQDEFQLEDEENFYNLNGDFFKIYQEVLSELIELNEQSAIQVCFPEQKEIGYFRTLKIQKLLELTDSYFEYLTIRPVNDSQSGADVYPRSLALYLDYEKGPQDAEFEELKSSIKEILIGYKPKYLITSEDAKEYISKISGIKISDEFNSKMEKYQKIEQILGKRVKGQSEAISQIATSLRRADFGLNDPNRPVGTFLFLGRTGVGKTELAKALAKFMFDDEKAMVRLDMSEYNTEHRVWNLIGPSRGYRDSEMGGVLTEAVKKTPECVVLLDEIEKAHPSVYNIFLQVFDDGRLTDGLGETVDFTKTLIIMTSNLGSKTLSKISKRAGFGATEDSLDKKQEFERAAMKELRERMSPEFINRIDSQVYFNSLSEDVIKEIAINEFSKLGDRLLDNKKITLHPDEAAIGLAVEKGYDEEMGARPLRRLIEQEVGNLIVDECLRLGYEKDVDIAISATDGENPQFKLTITPKVTERSSEFQR
jgi:ATP-dependent Clp protease ATP-binding subunit ClpB